MVGWRAWVWRCGHRASAGTQKMFWARYSSGSSGSAPWSISQGFEPGVGLFEGVGDVLEEDEAEDDVFVFGGVHAAPEGVGHAPELGLVAGDGVAGFGCSGGGHCRFSEMGCGVASVTHGVGSGKVVVGC